MQIEMKGMHSRKQCQPRNAKGPITWAFNLCGFSYLEIMFHTNWNNGQIPNTHTKIPRSQNAANGMAGSHSTPHTRM